MLGKGTCHQVDEGEELPAASVGLVSRHVQGSVVAEDGEVRQQDGDPEDLRRDQRHDEVLLPLWEILPVLILLVPPARWFCSLWV